MHEAREACRRWRSHGDASELDKAWDIYYGVSSIPLRLYYERTIDFDEKVFKKVEKQLPQLTTLDLQYVSPSLLKAKSLELAVPGKQLE